MIHFSFSIFGKGIRVALLITITSVAYFGYEVKGQPTQFQDDSFTDVESYTKLIQHQDDGSLLLHAEDGKAVGSEIAYMPEWQAYGWFTSSSRVEWEVDVEKSGDYSVYLEWSVSDEDAGKPFVFSTGEETVTGTVGRTGSWENYDIEKIGRVHLYSGRHDMVFEPDSDFEEGALLDLRGVYLIPEDVVRPLPDGSLLLHAEDGRPYGPEIQYMSEWQAYGWFTASSEDMGWDVSSRVVWNVDVGEAGEYAVFLEWSVSDEEAGKPFVFVTDGGTINGTIGRSGSWANYEIERIGAVQLSSGTQQMTFSTDPEYEEGGAVLDLRGVYLVPITEINDD